MQSQQRTVWAVLVTTFGLATICLASRLFSRRLKKAPFWWDDFFAIGTYVVAVAWFITCPIWMSKGLGLHITDVTWLSLDETIKQSKLILFVAEIIYAFGLFCAKMSILFFYWRLFSITNLRIPILVLMGMSIAWIIVRTFMAIFHCVPVQAFWDLTITNAQCNIDDKKFFFGSVLAHLLIDTMIVTLPILQISRMKLRKIQKVGVIALFLLGFLVCVCAIAIVVNAAAFDTTSVDITWNVTSIVNWATAEVNLVTVSACFPTIRPAFSYFFGRWLPRSILATDSGGRSHGVGDAFPPSRTARTTRLSMAPKPDARSDEASLTYKLANLEGSAEHDSDPESHSYARQQGVSHTAAVTSRQDEAAWAEEGLADVLGIAVKKETHVEVSGNHDVTHGEGYADHEAASSRSFA